jgi:hypothetical protein
MSSLTAVILVFLLLGLAVVAAGMLFDFLVRIARHAIARRRFRRELSADWWPSFERELRTYASKSHRSQVKR